MRAVPQTTREDATRVQGRIRNGFRFRKMWKNPQTTREDATRVQGRIRNGFQLRKMRAVPQTTREDDTPHTHTHATHTTHIADWLEAL